MLNGKEKKVLTAIVLTCKEKESALISPIDLIKISKLNDTGEEELEKIVTELSMDGYFDLVLSDRHGEKIYCINIAEKGKGFLRSQKVAKRNILFRIGLTCALAVLSFVIGIILKAIF